MDIWKATGIYKEGGKIMSGETPDDNDQCDEANREPPSSLEYSKVDATTLSSITDTILVSPINAGYQIKPFDMGLPSTPPCWVLQMPQDKMLEDGYDTDMHCWKIKEKWEENLWSNLEWVPIFNCWVQQLKICTVE